MPIGDMGLDTDAHPQSVSLADRADDMIGRVFRVDIRPAERAIAVDAGIGMDRYPVGAEVADGFERWYDGV